MRAKMQINIQNASRTKDRFITANVRAAVLQYCQSATARAIAE